MTAATLSPIGGLKDLYDVGDAPPVGHVPASMHAWLIRPERFGKPLEAFQKEVVAVPAIADDEVLVYVMAAGVNYNNVWAGLPRHSRERDRRPQQGGRAGAAPYRRLRRLRNRLQGRQGRQERQGRRRGRDALRPLQPRLSVG